MLSQIGIRTITRSPPSGEGASATSPPWLRATSRAMVRPRPTPPVSTLRDSSSRQVAEYLAARAHYRSAVFEVSRFVLFSSRASVGGGPYVVEEAYPLATYDVRRVQHVG